jgi:zinc transporter ZupT
MHLGSLLLLGFIAGATIIIGLPVGRLKSFNATMRAVLSMLAAGILVFLLVEVLSDASNSTLAALESSTHRPAGILLAVLLALGLFVGFVGLVWFEQKVIRRSGGESSRRLSFMIAGGIGLHNLSEGLAIGQSYAQGATGLTVALIVGFALHNTTEGFGIVGPVVQKGERLSWGNLLLLGAIGGGPTFLGTLLGSLWTSPYLAVPVLAMAAGALLYVIKMLFSGVSREARQIPIMAALVLGFMVGWVTGFVADHGARRDAQVRSPSMAVSASGFISPASESPVQRLSTVAGAGWRTNR